MSGLESVASKLLTPLIRGEQTFLPQADQEVIARWFVKTAMVLEQGGAASSKKFFHPAECAQIRASGIPSAVLLIEIGQMQDSRVAAHGEECDLRISFESDDGLSGKGTGYVSTIAVGELFAQQIFVRLPEQAMGRPFEITNLAGRQEEGIPIWPFCGAQFWPPRRALTLNQLRERAEAVSRQGA